MYLELAPFLLKALLVSAAVLALAQHFRRAHPFPRIGPANVVTATRGVLVALIAGLVGTPHGRGIAWAAIGVVSLAASLDLLDGYLARRTRMVSAFGARFDMEIDAFLILVLSLLAWQTGKAGAWVVASGLLRYAFIAASWHWAWLDGKLAPSWRRKAVCVIQITALIVTIGPIVPPSLSQPIAAAALGLLIWSFLVDVLGLRRSARLRLAASSA